MPFINVKTNCSLGGETVEAIKSKLGQAITDIPGKSESWLMVEVEDGKKLFFKGSDAPAAMVQVSVYGSASGGALEKLTGHITEILGDEAKISADRIYVSYASTGDWGWNGSNF